MNNQNQIRHRSPKTQNNFFNNYYLKSPVKKDINIINLDVSSKRNQINYNYNYNNTNNYYEEITKAFNYITFILKKKDSQIKEMKIKIKELEQQLNDINETNIMTFNNKDITEIYSDETSKQNKNNLKRITYNNNIPNKTSIFFSKRNNNENNKKINNNNLNIINRIKNSTNINKINNYRNKIDLNGNKLIYINNNDKYLNTEENKRKINTNINNINNANNINEHSNEKKNVNIIRKEPYYNNMNIKYRNSSGNKSKNFPTNETDTSTGNDKLKLYNLSYMGRANSKNSKNNSISLSDEGLSKSKTEIKNYLKEIKYKIAPDKFKKFVELIKILVKNKNTGQKNNIIYEIKNLLVDKNLIDKFENILKIK